MTFLTPWAAVTVSALALPALLFLYFLKLRRLPLRISSTLLWRKAVEDLQVNAPFQRLRITLLFLLQLLILTLFLLALGQPVIEGEPAASSRMILLIDRSASMNARTGAGETRLDRAKAAAGDIIDRLGSAGNPSEAMVIAFAAAPEVVSAFDGDRRGLREAVASIRPTDEPANLAAALELADAFSGATEEDEAGLPVVILVSDGGVAAAEDRAAARRGFRVRAVEVRFIQIGDEGGGGAAANLGIAAISARRRFDDPSRVDLFLRVLNSGALEAETALTVRIDDAPVAVRGMTIPGATDDGPGEAPASFDLELPGGGLVTASLSAGDVLATDDVAALVMAEPQPPAILLVARDGAPDPFLLGLLESAEPRALNVRSPASFDESEAGARQHDLIIFDRAAPARLPSAPSLFFGALPPGIEAIATDRGAAGTGGGGRRILSWNRGHPLMQHVELDDLVFEGFAGFAVPGEMQDEVIELALSRDGPVIGVIEGRDAQHVFAGFELVRSNWPADVSLLIFLKNVIDQALGLRGSGESIAFRTGEVARVLVAPGADRIVLSGPAEAEIETGGRSHITLPAFGAAGVYRVEGAAEPMTRIAVNLDGAIESHVRPRDDLVINAEAVSAGRLRDAAARELWPWLVAAALVLLVVEWLVYAIRTRG